MYRRILLCYNGTVEGRRALREGAQLALRLGAETHLLSVSQVPPGGAEASAFAAPLGPSRQALNDILDEGVQRLRELGLTAVGHLAFGVPVTEIVACARRIPADLVVVGHRNRSTFARWWINSVDMSLLENAPCSILVALQEADG